MPHLAQLNIGRFRYPTDDPRMADFMNKLDLVNGLAERSRVSSGGSRTKAATRPISGRSPIRTWLVNLSVWESVEALERYV